MRFHFIVSLLTAHVAQRSCAGIFLFRFGLRILLVALSLIVAGCGRPRKTSETIEARQIISLAPSITQTILYLGSHDRLVGVTSFCVIPDSLSPVERVGGYIDPNFERMITLKPDLAILYEEHAQVRSFLDQHGIAYLPIKCNTLSEICSSFVLIGRACGRPREADTLVARFQQALAVPTAGQPGRKVLVCIGRDDARSGSISRIYIAGRKTFYNEILESLGAKNAYPDSLVAYPQVSAEGVISMAPDIILDVSFSMANQPCEKLQTDWRGLSMVPAVKNNSIYCMDKDDATLPGPGLLRFISELREILK